jgi:nucleotide-binding universal stress UspA family protein
MSRFRRILVAFDGSDPARHALAAALELARPLGARLEVLTVEGPLPRYAATIGEVEEAARERETFFAGVLAEARALAAAHGVEVTTSLHPGHPAEEIVRHAEAIGADLIVVGHRGHFLQRLPLGSTAARVTRHAHCPVMVVR